MCFTPAHTLFYAVTLTGASIWSYRNPIEGKQYWMVAGWFAVMEWIQYVSYVVLANEKYAQYNAAITIMAYVQICFQGFITHYGNGHASPDLLRFIFLISVSDLLMTIPIPGITWNPDPNPYRWMAGTEWRTWQGAYHLAWSVPQTLATYYRPGFNHFLTLLWPLVAVGKWKQMLGLFVTGPLMSEWVVGGDVNQAGSVWCFQSVVIALVPMVRHSKLDTKRKMVGYMVLAVLLCYNYYLVWWLGQMSGSGTSITCGPHTY